MMVTKFETLHANIFGEKVEKPKKKCDFMFHLSCDVSNMLATTLETQVWYMVQDNRTRHRVSCTTYTLGFLEYTFQNHRAAVVAAQFTFFGFYFCLQIVHYGKWFAVKINHKIRKTGGGI